MLPYILSLPTACLFHNSYKTGTTACGGRHWLAQPPSQDILSSKHHNLINTEKAAVSASENCKVESVWREMDQQQASGQLQRMYVRRGIVFCVCVCVW
jgi:hypothetical protein